MIKIPLILTKNLSAFNHIDLNRPTLATTTTTDYETATTGFHRLSVIQSTLSKCRRTNWCTHHSEYLAVLTALLFQITGKPMC